MLSIHDDFEVEYEEKENYFKRDRCKHIRWLFVYFCTESGKLGV